ncbi:hypothetical protein GCM10023196_099230 [Actinoallomurus vinaceus]|uniref:Uncharacterized protein n=1 Tax=Actinoallomurus vinaceus TaxID=1080074 RepID=A0ABP8UUS1_9ACTN
MDQIITEFLIKVNKALGIAVRGETVTKVPQFTAQCGVIVDLAVEDRDHGSVLVVNRLIPTGHVDDCEAPHAECGVLVIVEARTIRPAVSEHLAHAAEKTGIRMTH